MEHKKLVKIANKILTRMEDPLDVWAMAGPLELRDIVREYHTSLEDAEIILDIINYRP